MRRAVIQRSRAFTLIELLVVIAIIALLVALAFPSLSGARRSARSAICKGNLHGLAHGLVLYANDHRELVIPSYTMTGTQGGPGVPLEGWAAILDRDGYVPASRSKLSNACYCPDTVDVAGVESGQTGDNPNHPKGWLEWPFERNGSSNVAVSIVERGFERILRVSYWINADNPIGAVASVTPDLFYTASVGYGPSSNGLTIRQTKSSLFLRPQSLITLADGVYAGRQRDNRIGTTNSRIGYRHGGKDGVANTAFADGHVAPLGGRAFPRGLGGSNPPAEVKAENTTAGPSVYANPERVAWP